MAMLVSYPYCCCNTPAYIVGVYGLLYGKHYSKGPLNRLAPLTRNEVATRRSMSLCRPYEVTMLDGIYFRKRLRGSIATPALLYSFIRVIVSIYG